MGINLPVALLCLRFGAVPYAPAKLDESNAALDIGGRFRVKSAG